MNMQRVALDDAGQIVDLVIFTSARIQEICGRPFNTRLAGVMRGTVGVGKPFAMDNGPDLTSILSAYQPPAVTVVGASGEEDLVAGLQNAINAWMSVHNPSGAPQ